MRPIPDPGQLTPGTTLYHSAFGFASVAAVAEDRVELAWAREGAHLPNPVKWDALQRVYSACATDGFFHRALNDKDGLAHTLSERPADALVRLVEDLDAPQRVRDLMDWMVGLELFTPKTFVRWWATAEPAVRADSRLRLDGEALCRVDASREPIRQLAPEHVDPEDELELEVLLDELTDEAGLPDDDTTSSAAFEPMEPVSLVEARPPAVSLPSVGLALARALVQAHGEGRIVHPRADSTILEPDGRARFLPSGPGHASWEEPASHAADLRAAAVTLLEAFLGRALPPVDDPARLLPFLRRRLPDAPPSAFAPIVRALRIDPAQRPDAFAWLAQWEEIVDIERSRPSELDGSAILSAGYDSHVGRVKLMLTQTNQDAVSVRLQDTRGLFVVADGISLSDAGRGDQAAWIGAQALTRLWSRADAGSAPAKRLIDTAYHLANRAIVEHATRAAGGDLTGRTPAGTTITAAVTRGNRVHLSWLGDSRAYLLGPWGISQLTGDDNVSGEALDAWFSGEARAWSADGHALTRYLGHTNLQGEPAPFPAHHYSFVLRPGERLLICSDGITDYVESHEAELAVFLHEAARHGELHATARALVDRANQRGGGDNATVVILECETGSQAAW